MPNRFWNYDETEGQPSTLRLEGPIAEESWWGDEVTPDQFRQELAAHPGDLTVYINSPGGDVVAGSLIYSMLRDHPGRITVRIDGIAASAASVVAMAGDVVEMAPTAYMMIHNAATIAWGDNREMRRAADMLDEINRGIRAAYVLKTGKSERELTRMMDAETWMSAPKALEEGFCDAISYAPQEDATQEAVETGTDAASGAPANMQGISRPNTWPLRPAAHAYAYSARLQLENTIQAAARSATPEPDQDQADALRARLKLLSIEEE